MMGKIKKTALLVVTFMSVSASLTAQVNVRLKEAGMENIRSVTTEHGSITAFEDRVYRSSYAGVGKAIEAALAGTQAGDICLIVTDRNGIPQLKVHIGAALTEQFRNGTCSLEEIYRNMELTTDADRELELLEEAETEARSAGRPDLTIYPTLFLENSSFDKLYRYAVALAPTLEMPLWKGAELRAQVIIPVATNQQGELKQVRPGFVTLQQGFYLKRNWRMQVTAGQFDNHRMGGQAEAGWRSPKGRWELGGRLGATTYSIFDNQGWTVSRNWKLDASVYGRAYIPQWNTELCGEVHRFVYGDYGVLGEVTRHFGEYTVGVYAMLADGDMNGGFSFAIPLPGKKYRRWKGVRVKPADYFAFRYGMVAWGEYVDQHRGETYRTEPDQYRSKGFYQPEYVRYFLLKELERENKRN